MAQVPIPTEKSQVARTPWSASGPAAISARARSWLSAPSVITGDSSRPVKGSRVWLAADITAPRTRLPGPAGPGPVAGTGPVTLDQDPAPPESGPAAS